VGVVGYYEREDGENATSTNFVMNATLCYKPGLNEGGRAPKQAAGIHEHFFPVHHFQQEQTLARLVTEMRW
jgi:hypothetical protein